MAFPEEKTNNYKLMWLPGVAMSMCLIRNKLGTYLLLETLGRQGNKVKIHKLGECQGPAGAQMRKNWDVNLYLGSNQFD